MKKVHMMIGIPGSGKTRFAKVLAKKLNCPLVSISMLRSVKLDCSDKDVLKNSFKLCGEYLNKNNEVVYDARNITKIERDNFINALKQQGIEFQITAYYIKADVETCIKRIIFRNDTTTEKYYSPEKVRISAAKLEPPTDKEFSQLKIIEN